MKKPVLKSLTIATLAMAAVGAHAAISFDQKVTNAVINGTGIGNGGFTVGTDDAGIEIGLRAHKRYPTPADDPANVGGTNFDNTYQQAAGGFTSGGVAGGTLASWNWDWSINTDVNDGTVNLSNFTYVMGIDYDPSSVANPISNPKWVTFNPINGATTCADNAFGNNDTLQSGGAYANCVTGTPSYAGLVSGNNLVQNSWNMDFFSAFAPAGFDANANGQYSIFLEVYLPQNDGPRLLARDQIEVIVSGATPPTSVPEPGSLALVGLGLAGLAAARRRKQKQ